MFLLAISAVVVRASPSPALQGGLSQDGIMAGQACASCYLCGPVLCRQARDGEMGAGAKALSLLFQTVVFDDGEQLELQIISPFCVAVYYELGCCLGGY
ncbi:hypothetical protein B0T25DRAFT_546035 [Lasiosphaeria hispida]|uniref:Uncharacterized protein n=1 Tax=Lasiosphaeria hispida TaxID=260671 RepID=A0AAJ0MBH1_9PEZI|nr:hypothetical protein B0T25DRAFT_546035 [Lasiosphaeria hispida]